MKEKCYSVPHLAISVLRVDKGLTGQDPLLTLPRYLPEVLSETVIM
jgi:hypothetical protein